MQLRDAGAAVVTGDVQPTPRMRQAPGGVVQGAANSGATIIDQKYEVVRQLGQGGMGAVYETRHRATGRRFAVKVIAPFGLVSGVGVLARFQREARASGSIDSPYVVQTFDAGVDRATGAPYMAMECLAGEDVQTLVARVGPLRPEVVLCICAHTCHGLQKAHEAGIVHRDIKSANLFLARRGGDSNEIITKILDFGIAKVRASPVVPLDDNKLTTTGSMLGSPVYMSPEQAIGAKDLDARSDIFSLGVMMYEALSGTTPNGHLDCLGALVMAVCSQPAPPLQLRAPWVPAAIAAIVHKALAIRPADRFQSAAELRDAVVALLVRGDTSLRSDMLGPLKTEEMAQIAVPAPRQEAASAFVATVLSPTAPPPRPAMVAAVSIAPPPPARRIWPAIAAVTCASLAVLATYWAFEHRAPQASAEAAVVVNAPQTPVTVTPSATPLELTRSEGFGRRDEPAVPLTSVAASASPPSPRPRVAVVAPVAPPPPPSPDAPVLPAPPEPPHNEAPRPAPKALVPIDRGDPWSAAK